MNTKMSIDKDTIGAMLKQLIEYVNTVNGYFAQATATIDAAKDECSQCTAMVAAVKLGQGLTKSAATALDTLELANKELCATDERTTEFLTASLQL